MFHVTELFSDTPRTSGCAQMKGLVIYLRFKKIFMIKLLRSSEIQVPELGKTEIWKILTKFNTTFQHLEHGDVET